MIDPFQLLKKLRVSTTSSQTLQQSSRISQFKLSKHIYNNRNIRDIPKFIRQANSVLRKSKQQQQKKRVVTEYEQKKGRYDQNQLKQLTYQFKSVRDRYLVDIQEILSKNQYNNNESKLNLSKRPNLRKITSFNQERIRKRQPTINTNLALPNINRMKSLSLSTNKTKQRIPSSKQPPSPGRYKSKINLNFQNIQVKISFKQNELQLALKNLIQRVGTKQSKDYYIPHDIIFSMIQRYYKLKNPQQNQQKMNLLMTLLNPSFQQTQAPKKFQVEIPYCQFLCLKDCRKSIQRIFNLPIKAAQRIAFKIYDRNNNGIIDQKDIIQLFTVAQQFPAMQQDMQIIIKNYKINSTRTNSKVNISNRYSKKNNASQEYSLDKLNRIQIIQQNPNQQNKKVYESQKFRKDIFFTFNQTKKQFFKKQNKNNAKIALTWQDFQIAFKNIRPQIYYDLLDYLFNINSEQVYDNAQKAAYEKDKKSYRFNIFNSDGKSQVGSIYKNQQSQRNQFKKQNSYRKLQRLSPRKKQNTEISSQQKSKNNNIQSLINKVISVQQFTNIKY